MNTCPKCGCQLEVKLVFASGPKSQSHDVEGKIGELLEAAEGQDSLTPFEKKFLADLRERYDKWGETTRLSDKQRDVLGKIGSK